MDNEPALIADARAAGLLATDIPALRQHLRTLPRTGPDLINAFVARVALSAKGMMLTLLAPTQRLQRGVLEEERGDGIITMERFVSHVIRQRGVEMRLVLEGGPVQTRDDPALLKAVARARCWFDELTSGKVASANELAIQLGVSARYVQRLLPLALLTPRLAEQIAAGRHGAVLTVDMLSKQGMLPLRWSEHDAHLG